MREIIVLFDKKEAEKPKDKCDLCSHAFVGEIVRCKDCRHRYEEGDCTHYYWCRVNDRPIDDTDFCAWGERIEE